MVTRLAALALLLAGVLPDTSLAFSTLAWVFDSAGVGRVVNETAHVTHAAFCYFRSDVHGQVPDPGLPFKTWLAAAPKTQPLLCVGNFFAGAFQPGIARSVMGDANKTGVFVSRLLQLSFRYGFKGVLIDFEGLQPSDKASFTAFIGRVATPLRANKLSLVVSVDPAANATDLASISYDYAALGKLVDLLDVRTWGVTGPSTGPGPTAPISWMKQVMSYAIKLGVASTKLSMTIPAFGFWWDFYHPIKTNGVYVFNQEATLMAGRKVVDVDGTANFQLINLSVTGTSSNATATSLVNRTVWIEDSAGIKLKSALATTLKLGFVSVRSMGEENHSYWMALLGLKS